jgi:hypothetical protein
MTPKEKAIAIASRMLARCFQYDVHINVAKECALVTVDEILFAIQDLPLTDVNWDYWHQVKKEIEKL